MKTRMLSLVAVMVALFGLATAIPNTPFALAQSPTPAYLDLVAQTGGSLNALAVQSNYAYVGEGDHLTILDVSDRTKPTLVGKTSALTNAMVSEVVVANGYAYASVANDTNVYVVDVRQVTKPVIVGSVFVGKVQSIGSPLFIAANILYTGSYPESIFFDLSNPAQPTKLGTYNGWGKIFVSGTTAYLVTREDYSKFVIIDVSNPKSPLELGKLPLTGYASDIYVVNNIAYVIKDSGQESTSDLVVFDVSNPANPKQLGSMKNVFSPIATLRGNYLYTAGGVIDVSDSTNLFKVGELLGYSDLILSDNTLYGTNSNGLQAIDLSSPTAPKVVGSYKPVSNIGSIQLAGNLAYVTHRQSNNFSVYDLSNLTNPTLLGTLTDTIQVSDFHIFNKTAYINRSGGCRIVDISNPGSMTVLSSTCPGYIMQVVNNIAYVYGYDSSLNSAKLQLFNISIPSTPVKVGSYSMVAGAGIKSVYVTNNRAYVSVSSTTDGESMLILDVSNPATPTKLGEYKTGSAITRIQVIGNVAYLLQTDYFRLVDIANPNSPVSLGVFGLNTTHYPANMAISNNVAYVVGHFEADKKVIAIDVSNLNSVTKIDDYFLPSCPTYSSGADIFPIGIQGNNIYVGTFGCGLFVFNLKAGTKPTPTPTATAVVSVTPSPTNTPLVSVTPSPTDTPTPTPTNTATSIPTTKTFQVGRDGLAFNNFNYYKTNIADSVKWEQFKKTFPSTQMELANGQRRKGPLAYYNSMLYQSVGIFGNCAGFTGASLVRYSGLTETIELSLLSASNQTITSVNQLPNSSDVKDYIHLYQARQLSEQFTDWWNGSWQVVNGKWVNQNRHYDDTPLQTYQAIKASSQPVAVDIQQDDEGHRMVAYRTEEANGTGYIYVYDSNWPNNSNRRIQINLTTGQWEYELWPGTTWGDNKTNLFYALASLNTPAQLMSSYDFDSARKRQGTNQPTNTILTLDGATTLLVKDAQGHELGYKNGNLVKEIEGGTVLYRMGYSPDNPTASNVAGLLVPTGSNYSVTIEPISTTAQYTLTAFNDGSALTIADVQIAANSQDSLILSNGSVLSTTFKPATDNSYCYAITSEATDSSREMSSCINNGKNSAMQFGLTTDGLTLQNQGTQVVSVTTTIDQVGAGSQQKEVSNQLSGGQTVIVKVSATNTYLPLIIK